MLDPVSPVTVTLVVVELVEDNLADQLACRDGLLGLSAKA
jgi:hypothetical protein